VRRWYRRVSQYLQRRVIIPVQEDAGLEVSLPMFGPIARGKATE